LRSNVDWAVLGGVLLQLVGGFMAASASAGEFRLSPSILVEEGATDNARQGSNTNATATGGAGAAASGRGADLFTRISPNLGMSSQGGRVRFNLNYGLRHVFYMDNSDLDSTTHSLAHSGSAELI
jgi:uncharacterized protein (PEP-CTERM system associated)